MNSKLTRILTVLALVLTVSQLACSKGDDQATKTDTQATTTATAPVEITTTTAPVLTTGSTDGTYVFDSEMFISMLSKTNDPNMQNIPENVRQQMVDTFKTFKIEVKGDEATASFGTDVLKGKLSKLGEESGAVKFLMTPLDEAEKNNTVNLIIKGDTLTIDPGKTEADKMYFKKSA
jgi:hypothetical protein